QLPMPMWVGQRLWIGTTLFAAGAGFVWLAKRLSLSGGALLAGALVYQLSPYTLAYLGRTTVILLPWAALPWLIGLARRSLREGGWRAPAWFALVVTLVGSTNASSLVFIGLAPVLWFPFAVWISREADLKSAVAAMLRIGALLLPTQLWWIAGLSLQASYGLPILELTETITTVAETSTAAEIVRHLGYWYFYGRDGLEPWTEASRFYTQNLGSIVVSYTLPALACVAAFTIRWRYRSYAIGLVILGLVIGMGAHPYESPPPAASAFKAAADVSAAGMALRNSPRAVPLMVLGFALLTAAGLCAMAPALERWRGGRHRVLAPVAVALVALLAIVNMPPLWTGGIVQSNLEYPEDLPDHWDEVAAEIDARNDGSRVMELPGMDFGTYRWGNTQDVITPGLVDRPWVGRQLIPFGTPASADLIRAFDKRIQEGHFEPESIGPIARLLGVGDVLLRNDTQYERYRNPRPQPLWTRFAEGIPGLEDPVSFGEPTPNEAVEAQPMIDEVEVAIDPDAPHPPPLVLFDVPDPRAELRTANRIGAIVAGDGDGVVELAGAGLLPHDPFVYSASYADRPEQLAALAEQGARLVLTDTNRRRAQRWGTLRENDGYTEEVGEEPLVDDPSDARLVVFPDAGDSSFTTTDLRGIAAIRSSVYGNPVSYTPEDRPSLAVDGNLATSWKVAAFDKVRGEKIQVELDVASDTDHVVVVQDLGGGNRWITEVEVHIDGESIGHVELTEASRAPDGQRIELPAGGFQTLTLTITDSNVRRLVSYAGFSPVGFAEIQIPGIVVDEIVRLPADLLTAAGDAAATAPLDVVLSRLRSSPKEPVRRDPEAEMHRSFDLPVARTFTLTGTARISEGAATEILDTLLGRGPEVTGLIVRNSDNLSGALQFRGSAAIDGDPSTFWSPGFTGQHGRWIEVESTAPLRVERLDLQIVADGRHTVPTRVEVSVDGTSVELDLPEITDGTEENHVVDVPLQLPQPLEGHIVRLTVLETRDTLTKDYFSTKPLVMPIGIAELGIEGVEVPPIAEQLADTCHDGLITVNGQSIPVRISGSTADAAALEALPLEPCDPASLDLALAAGEVIVRTTSGRLSGIDIDRLVLSSPAVEDPAIGGAGGSASSGMAPTVEVTDESRLSRTARITGVDGRFLLVFGQSHSDGWTATIDGIGDLGEPFLVDGYANAWWVDPPAGVDELVVEIEWTPQRRVWIGIALSLLAALGCLAILLLGRRRPVVAPDRHAAPILDDPTRHPGRRPGPVALVLTTVGLGLGAFLLGGVAVALPVATAVAVALIWRRGRLALAIPGPLMLGPVAVWVAGIQWRREHLVGVEWPSAFDPAKWFVLAAILMIGADVIVGRVRRRTDRTDLHK
ncbi:MAG: DUF3367 domain-containing protein, partial [Acidimicrobiia bacterium]|nr:DUF3367 domain-containing protein [Acidimicrobiia bacterium]